MMAEYSIDFKSNSGNPATPTTDRWKLFNLSGAMYLIDDSGEQYPIVPVYRDTVNTTDGTQTTLATIVCANGTTTLIEGYVFARRTGGGSGSAEDGAGYRIAAVYKASAGTATEIGESVTVIGESQAGWDVDFAASSGNALIRVTGAASNNVSWRAEYTVRTISS